MVWLENGCGNRDREAFLPELALTEEKGGEANGVVESQLQNEPLAGARCNAMQPLTRRDSWASSPHSAPSNLERIKHKHKRPQETWFLQVLLDVVEDIEPDAAL